MGFNPRRALAVNLGKLARLLSRRLGKGGGTILPGVLALKIDRGLVGTMAAQIPGGLVLVTGTNGKTTTCRIIAAALKKAGFDPIQNREGSNLIGGVATTLLLRCDFMGRPRFSAESIGIFELDEGTFPQALRELEPRVILLTNLFRDQLDRYFEVDYLATLWRHALRSIPPRTVVVLNADDPQLAHLGVDLPNPVLYYGLEDTRYAQGTLQHAADARRCPRCTVDFQYGVSFYAHLGHYSCLRCGWQRPRPQVSAWRVDAQSMDSYDVRIVAGPGELMFHLALPGLYNVYNALAGVAALTALGVDYSSIREAAPEVPAAFGRWEWASVNGRRVCIALAKNPTGFNEVLRTLFSEARPKPLLLALNDNVPDGRDVSWIWDIDLENIGEKARFVVAAGLRANELALRLKYAGVDPVAIIIEGDVWKAFWLAIERTEPGETLYVVPTYTAMWELRAELARAGYVKPFWE